MQYLGRSDSIQHLGLQSYRVHFKVLQWDEIKPFKINYAAVCVKS